METHEAWYEWRGQWKSSMCNCDLHDDHDLGQEEYGFLNSQFDYEGSYYEGGYPA